MQEEANKSIVKAKMTSKGKVELFSLICMLPRFWNVKYCYILIWSCHVSNELKYVTVYGTATFDASQ